MDKHVTASFLAWEERTLAEPERLRIDTHLRGCAECRNYFEKMSAALGDSGAMSLPELTTDPFLPARIRANAGSAHSTDGLAAHSPRFVSVLRVSGLAITASIALIMGIQLGKGIAADTLYPDGRSKPATGRAAQPDAISGYYSALSGQDADTTFAAAFAGSGKERAQ